MIRDLARIKNAGFNGVLLFMWHGNGARWPNPSEVRVAPDFSTAMETDPVEFFIAKAHSMGIEVHATFTIGLRQGIESDAPWDDFFDAGTSASMFNLWNTGFRAKIAAVVAECLSRYDWDGYELDYMRTNGVWSGDAAEAQYASDTGGDWDIDHAIWMGTPGQSPNGLRMSNWIVAAVEDTMDVIFAAVEDVKPGLEVSAYGVADYVEWTQGRRIAEWINSGRIDWGVSSHGGGPGGDLRSGIDTAYENVVDDARLSINVSNYHNVGETIKPMAGGTLVRNISQVVDAHPGSGIIVYFYGNESGSAKAYLSPSQIDALHGGPLHVLGQRQIQTAARGAANMRLAASARPPASERAAVS